MAQTIEQEIALAEPRRRFKKRYSNIGLDIGSAQIKLIQFKNKRGRICLHQYGIFPLPQGAVEGGRIADPLLLAVRLRQYLRRRGLHKNRVNLCIGGLSVVHRQVLLPAMTAREIPQAIRWEAEKHVMFPLDEAVVDYSCIGERVVDGKTVAEIVLVATPKKVVNSYIELVTRVGLYPEVIEIEPFALHRAIRRTAALTENSFHDNLLILDIGGESSNLLVLERGRYSFSRVLNIGVYHFLHRVVETAEVDLEKARCIVFGARPFEMEAVLEVADDLSRQIQRSLEYYALEMWHQEQEFERIIICGGGAFIPGLGAFLGHELKVEPKMYSFLNGVECGDRFLKEDLQQNGNMLQIACGLALRGWLK